MPKYSLKFRTGWYEASDKMQDSKPDTRYMPGTRQLQQIGKKRKIIINNESLEIVVCAKDKRDFTGALFKTCK